MANDINNLSHTAWNCKYHIVFALKYRWQVFYREKSEVNASNSLSRHVPRVASNVVQGLNVPPALPGYLY